MNYCIFRNINNCKCCYFKAKKNYCNLHSNNRNIIYEIINEAIGIKHIKTSQDIYQIFSYIYNNPDIYTKELIFKKILTTLFINFLYLKKIYPESNSIDEVFNLNMNTYNIAKKLADDNYNQLTKIKQAMYKFIIKPHIYNPDLNYTNSNDPFTFDLIEDIPIKERFVFIDNDNYYCFKANEFKYFISTNGNWNPYTKRPINPKIVRNLNIYITYYKLDSKTENQWNTINQAYTDVSQILEKMGFYNNTEWFLKLTSKQIKNVIKLFKLLTNDSSYFLNINDDNIFYDFAKDTIKLFENGNENFLLCCNYMKCLGMYSSDFYNSLPEWLSDIQTPIIIDNNNRNYEIVYLINVIDG